MANSVWRKLFPDRPASRVSVAFIRPQAMARVNRATRGRRGATTVLAFPFDQEIDVDPLVGEILLCPPAIRSWAKGQGQTMRGATVRLFLHALIHLAGYDHATPPRERRMAALENRLLYLTSAA